MIFSSYDDANEALYLKVWMFNSFFRCWQSQEVPAPGYWVHREFSPGALWVCLYMHFNLWYVQVTIYSSGCNSIVIQRSLCNHTCNFLKQNVIKYQNNTPTIKSWEKHTQHSNTGQQGVKTQESSYMTWQWKHSFLKMWIRYCVQTTQNASTCFSNHKWQYQYEVCSEIRKWAIIEYSNAMIIIPENRNS